MTLSPDHLRHLADLAIEAAETAGRMIASSRPQQVERKAGALSLASAVVTEIDRRSQALILELLTPTLGRFELGLLTEEQEDDRSRLEADYFWCIDPLDGTLPFIESSPGYAVSIALVARDGTPQIGVVYDPVEAMLLHAIAGLGVFRNRDRWSPSLSPHQPDPLLVFADRSFMERDDHDRLVAALEQIARDMGLADLRIQATGGAVMNACRVLAHPPACYFKFPKPTGGGSLWDFAATACLFHEAGAIATDIDGGPLDLNRADSTFMSHRGVLFATNGALARRIRALRPGAD
ncbi:MAG: inositol monophosphatase family protein [Myxococcota bacterium]